MDSFIGSLVGQRSQTGMALGGVDSNYLPLRSYFPTDILS